MSGVDYLSGVSGVDYLSGVSRVGYLSGMSGVDYLSEVDYLSGVDVERTIFSARLAMGGFCRLNRGRALRVRPRARTARRGISGGSLVCSRFPLLGGVLF